MGLALSTSWNAFRADNAKDLLFEISALGFREIELSFNLTPGLVREIKGIVGDTGLRVRSLHNYCPIPEGLAPQVALPDYFSMSSLDESERNEALKNTLTTIKTASELGAEAVVLHCGRVETPDRTRELIDLYEKGFKGSGEFEKIKGQAVSERSHSCKLHLDQTLKSLSVLNAAADKNKIKLGVETRYYYREIPAPEEIGAILNEFGDSQIYYWHDAGHAEVMERLSFFLHTDILNAFSRRMLGIHLHDVFGCKDHMAPGQGDLDFSKLRQFLGEGCITVMEVHHPATGEDLKKAKCFLEKLL